MILWTQTPDIWYLSLGRVAQITMDDSATRSERYAKVVVHDFSMDTAVFDKIDVGYLSRPTY